jgi:hypothetical protein
VVRHVWLYASGKNKKEAIRSLDPFHFFGAFIYQRIRLKSILCNEQELKNDHTVRGILKKNICKFRGRLGCCIFQGHEKWTGSTIAVNIVGSTGQIRAF